MSCVPATSRPMFQEPLEYTWCSYQWMYTDQGLKTVNVEELPVSLTRDFSTNSLQALSPRSWGGRGAKYYCQRIKSNHSVKKVKKLIPSPPHETRPSPGYIQLLGSWSSFFSDTLTAFATSCYSRTKLFNEELLLLKLQDVAALWAWAPFRLWTACLSYGEWVW